MEGSKVEAATSGPGGIVMVLMSGVSAAPAATPFVALLAPVPLLTRGVGFGVGFTGLGSNLRPADSGPVASRTPLAHVGNLRGRGPMSLVLGALRGGGKMTLSTTAPAGFASA